MSGLYLETAATSIAAQFEYNDKDVLKGVSEFIREMRLGLAEERPTMCQIPTYLTHVASGSEKGLALAVDLGGTNLRVCSVDLHGDTTYTAHHSRIAVPREIMLASHASTLFSFIAIQIKAFFLTYHPRFLEDENTSILRLGFTFSFPVHQKSINSGTLLRWTKGFEIADAVGKDVCQLLQFEIDALGLPIQVTALVNDAAGTIMARAYSLPLSSTRTSIGAIFGTGTNGVYLEKVANIKKPLYGKYDKSTGEMFISIEWGSFDNNLAVLPVTPFDILLDKESINPGNQMFEKRVSGMFLGELLRLSLLSLNADPNIILFSGCNDQLEKNVPPTEDKENLVLLSKWSVDSSILSIAEKDKSEFMEPFRKAISETFKLPGARVSLADAKAVKIIAHAIGKRAARLSGMSTAAVMLQAGHFSTLPLDKGSEVVIKEEVVEMGENKSATVDIGVDGSVIEFYPGFESYMRETFRIIPEIGTAEINIKLGITKDGSSVGAAIIALLAG
ncbi:hypothetical protein OCU04_004522 [Sclerotinia nivalis]|uniref:Phosphotransferase n=1 Tax=Sclerotinia nivalis TaxID=352851 RepID=A0A9X0AU01_9HELO|nr:hypothetical protein OCU04_004522 [Sclerotinia nivalis]